MTRNVSNWILLYGGILLLAFSGLDILASVFNATREPKVIPGTILATKEIVEGATLSPNGSDVALVTSKVSTSSDSDGREQTSVVQIWHLDQAENIGNISLSSFHYSGRTGIREPQTRVGERFIRYASDGKLLVVYDGEDIHVLELSAANARGPTQTASVFLQDKLRVPLNLGAPQENNLVQSMAVTDDGARVAIEMCNPSRGPAQMIRIYNLVSGVLLQEWKFETGCVFSGYNSLSWDRLGEKLAVSLPAYPGGSPRPFSFTMRKNHVYILNAKSGEILRDIRAAYLVGPVSFTPGDTLITASLNADPRYFHDDTINEWDVNTGRLVRRFDAPSQGVHSLLAISADGKSVLGYIGKEKPDEHFLDNVYLEFGLWDYKTGNLTATSGPIERPQTFPTSPAPTRLPSFGSNNDRMDFARAGNKVLLWWQQSTRPFLIFVTTPNDLQ